MYKKVITKYYKYSYDTWTQPVLSADGTLGGDSFAVTCGSYMANGEPYKCFTSNTSDGCYNDNIAVSDFWYVLYNPNPLNITSWQFYYTSSPTGNSGMDCPYSGIVYGSNDNSNYVQVGGWVVGSTNNTYKTIDMSENTGYYKYYKLQPTAYSDNDPMYGHMLITATQQISTECPESEADYSVVSVTNHTFKKVTTKYFKQTATTWQQPILGASGTMGGDAFAVQALTSVYSSNYDWKAFDGSTSTMWATNKYPGSLAIYNPVPINVTNIAIRNGSSYPPRTGDIEVSDNGFTWTKLIDWSTNSSTNTTWNIDLSSNTGYHKYYRINILTGINATYTYITEISLTATYLYDEQVSEAQYNTLYTTKYYKQLSLNALCEGGISVKEGIVESFSRTNHLRLPMGFAPGSNTWEINFKVKTGSISSSWSVFGNYGNTYQNAPEISYDSRYGCFKMTLPKDGGSTLIADNVNGTYQVQANTDYWLRLKFTGTQYIFSYSTDGTTYTDDITITSSETIYQAPEGFTIGANLYSTTASMGFSGSIDLNNSYIKVNDQYWWTGIDEPIVNAKINGTPTITDGVIDFSNGSLTTLSYPTDINTLEMNFKFTTPSSFSGISCFLVHEAFGDANAPRLVITPSGQLVFVMFGTPSSAFETTGNLSTNTTYIVNWKWNGTKISATLTDGSGNVQSLIPSEGYTDETTSIIWQEPVTIGVGASGYLMDLNECYIKVNDELWWQGIDKLSYPQASGSALVLNGVASGFSANDYLTYPQAFYPLDNPWEMVFKVNMQQTGGAITGENGAGYFRLGVQDSGEAYAALGTSSSSFDITTLIGSTIVPTDTWFYLKLEFTGSEYNLYYSTDGVNFNTEASFSSSTAVIFNNTIIGKSLISWKGSIDLKESYIKMNGVIWWQGAGDCYSWKQPVLTDNTSSDLLHVDATTVYGTDYDAWKSFKSDTTDAYAWGSALGSSYPQYYYMTFNRPVIIDKIVFRNRTVTYPGSIKEASLQQYIKGQWYDVKKFTNSNNISSQIWSIDVNSKVGAGSYRFRITQTNATSYVMLGFPAIYAKYFDYVETNSSDYDFTSDMLESQPGYKITRAGLFVLGTV